MPTDDGRLDRRKYLKAIGATSGVASLAGCGGDGGGSDGDTTTPGETTTTTDTTTSGTDDTTTTTEETTTSGTPKDSQLTVKLRMNDPTTAQFNVFNGKQYIEGGGKMYDDLVAYDRFNKEYKPRIAAEWDIGETVLLTVDTDYQWTKWQKEGIESAETKPVTAEDLALDFEMAKHIASDWPGNRAITDWEVKDDQTIELVPREDRWNDLIFAARALSRTVDVPRMMWADHAKELRNMEKGSEAFNSYLKENILDYRMDPSELWFNGPYYYDQTLAKREVQYARNPNYPRADQVEVPKITHWKTGAGREQNVQAILHDDIDHHPNVSVSPTVSKQFPDHWDRVVTGGLSGGAVFFNHEHRWMGKSDLRQAMVFAVDNSQVARNISRTPVGPRICGITNQSMKSNWLGDVLDGFSSYEGKQPERASELARSAGLEKNQNGWWADPSGDPIDPEFKAISAWTSATVMNQTIVSHLRDWGLKAEAVGYPLSEFFSSVWTNPEEMDPFEAIHFPVFVSPSVWHPFAYENNWYLSGGAAAKYHGDHTYEVPATIGDPDSAVETIDAPDMTDELAHTNDLQRQKEIVERLSWLYNQNAVAFVNNKPAGHGWWSNDDWSYPAVEQARDPPEAFENWGLVELIAQGTLTPKYEDA